MHPFLCPATVRGFPDVGCYLLKAVGAAVFHSGQERRKDERATDRGFEEIEC